MAARPAEGATTRPPRSGGGVHHRAARRAGVAVMLVLLAVAGAAPETTSTAAARGRRSRPAAAPAAGTRQAPRSGVTRKPSPPAARKPSSTNPDQAREELERLRKEAAEKRRLAKELQGREQDVQGQLRKSDEALNATRRLVRTLESRELGILNEIGVRQEALYQASQELERSRQRLAAWMREAYKHGRTRNLEVIFSSASFGDLLKRTYFLSSVMQQERHLMDAVKEQKRRVEDEKAQLESRRRDITSVKEEKEDEQKQYQSLKQAQKGQIARIRSQRKSYEQAARELEASAGRMQKLLADLEAQRRRTISEGKDKVEMELDRNNFGANRHRLPWPVTGDLIGRFGLETHPEWGTQIRNNGVDIQAPDGTAVHSVGDGRVEVADWLGGYGESVILNHGQGFYSVYAHLGSTSVKPGDRVQAGQTIGTVGDSGSLKGTCLHFEIRRGREAQDPEQWLR